MSINTNYESRSMQGGMLYWFQGREAVMISVGGQGQASKWHVGRRMEPAMLVRLGNTGSRRKQHGRSAIRSARLGKRATVRSGQAWMESPGFAEMGFWMGHDGQTQTPGPTRMEMTD